MSLCLEPDGRLAAVEASVRNGALETGEVRGLFNASAWGSGPTYGYDVSTDGQRILAITPRANSTALTLVQNWPALLKK